TAVVRARSRSPSRSSPPPHRPGTRGSPARRPLVVPSVGTSAYDSAPLGIAITRSDTGRWTRRATLPPRSTEPDAPRGPGIAARCRRGPYDNGARHVTLIDPERNGVSLAEAPVPS